MSDGPEKDRLAELEARIKLAKGESTSEPMGEHYSQAQHAWRMVTELVAGVGIGFGIGYGLDAVFGTTPWLMLVFTILGIVAGVKTMIRTAQELQDKTMAQEAASQESKEDNRG
jgi:ATP synthase protein I